MAPTRTYLPSSKRIDPRKRRKKRQREPLTDCQTEHNIPFAPKDVSSHVNCEETIKCKTKNKSPKPSNKKSRIKVIPGLPKGIDTLPQFFLSGDSEFSSINLDTDTTFDKLLKASNKEVTSTQNNVLNVVQPKSPAKMCITSNSKDLKDFPTFAYKHSRSPLGSTPPTHRTRYARSRQSVKPLKLSPPPSSSTTTTTTINTTITPLLKKEDIGEKLVSELISHCDTLSLTPSSPLRSKVTEVLSPGVISDECVTRTRTKCELHQPTKMEFLLDPPHLQSTPLALKSASHCKRKEDISPISFTHQCLSSSVVSPPLKGFDEGSVSVAIGHSRVAAYVHNSVCISFNASEDMFPSINDDQASCQDNGCLSGLMEKSREIGPYCAPTVFSQSSSTNVSEKLKNAHITTATKTTCHNDTSVTTSLRNASVSFVSAQEYSNITSSPVGHADASVTVEVMPACQIGSCCSDNSLDQSTSLARSACNSTNRSSGADNLMESSSNVAVASSYMRVNRYSLRSRKVLKNSYVKALDVIGEDECSADDERSTELIKPSARQGSATKNLSRITVKPCSFITNRASQSVMSPLSTADRYHQSAVSCCRHLTTPAVITETSCQSIMPPLAAISTNRQSVKPLPASTNTSRQSVRMPRCSGGKPRHSILNRRYSHQIVPLQLFNNLKPECLPVRDQLNITTSNLDHSSVASVQECVSLAENDVSKYLSQEVPTAQGIVLAKCGQDAPVPFAEAYSDKFLSQCTKIGEGLYGEVFKWKNGTESTVIKIIPINGEDLVNGERQKKFDEIISEIVIAQVLSGLRLGSANQTSSFVQVVNNLCVQGRYPQQLVDLWQEFADGSGTENDCPTVFNDAQTFIILELADGGVDLEKYRFTSSKQALSIFLQTAHALAVAEASIEFEHRDLHWGNVLISRTDKKDDTFIIDEQEYTIPTNGVQACIIDFTLSRMSLEGHSLYNDLSLDPTLFESEGDYQFEIYRKMKEECRNNWRDFRPYNNILWLHYLIKKMIDGVHYKNKKSHVHRECIAKLKTLEKTLLLHKSAAHFVSEYV